MNFFKYLSTKFCSILALLIFSSTTVFAGSGGVITMAPVSTTAVPTLSGTMLIVLSLLLMIVAFRVSKNTKKGTGKFFIALISASVLMVAGGLKTVTSLQAASGFEDTLTSPDGGNVDFFSGTLNTAINGSGVPQRISEVNYNFIDPTTCESAVTTKCTAGIILNHQSSCQIDCRIIGGE